MAPFGYPVAQENDAERAARGRARDPTRARRAQPQERRHRQAEACCPRKSHRPLTTLLAERQARHSAGRAQTLQDARKPMHTDPSTI